MLSKADQECYIDPDRKHTEEEEDEVLAFISSEQARLCPAKETRRWRCDHCLKTYARGHDLRYHVTQQHPWAVIKWCEECKKMPPQHTTQRNNRRLCGACFTNDVSHYYISTLVTSLFFCLEKKTCQNGTMHS